MSTPQEWEARVCEAVAELTAGVNTVALYGLRHPRAEQSVERLTGRLTDLLSGEPALPVVLIGDELFVQGRPFTRLARQAPTLIRRLRRCGVEQITFRRGVPAGEVRDLLAEIAAGGEIPVHSRAFIDVGDVELDEANPVPGRDKARSARPERVRDRVALVEKAISPVAGGRGPSLADLALVARGLHKELEETPNPLLHLAPWEGEERWPAVHAHNVGVLAFGLARLAGASTGFCRELAVAGMVHDVGRLLLPDEVAERDFELAGDDLELILDHPKMGFEVLLADEGTSPVALIVTLEHHLNFNGTGYPRMSRPRRPHPASRLVSVADAYDILRTLRAARGLASAESTSGWLLARAGSVLDPAWTRAVVELAGNGEPST